MDKGKIANNRIKIKIKIKKGIAIDINNSTKPFSASNAASYTETIEVLLRCKFFVLSNFSLITICFFLLPLSHRRMCSLLLPKKKKKVGECANCC
ncbi:unnamed protein product [Coffea canephora]|uniref:Uncharacterized protein n=1 Tax=Coffea canephora TaxID=49390 RepID=A0A068U2C2_COFCA|nr:unnamed protein product [Coffea canephora]